MGRASFEYDEVGNTFYYVLVAFYAIILFPATYFCLPGAQKAEPVHVINEHECQCDGCDKKRRQKAANKPWRRTKKIIVIVTLVVAWAIFAFIVKKTTEIEQTHKDYDPYQILGLDQGADEKAIKKAWRDLSKVHHPDRGGDAQFFDKIAKAHQALTDKEARENWEKYGNPDGPTATTFGIALPKWLVSKEYGLWVLAFYGLVFMVIMPVAVQPLSQAYALKARVLLHAYLSRLPLESADNALDQDQDYIITRILRFVEEMVSCSQNLMSYSQHTKISIETFDNLLKLQPMFVQALWQKNSPLLQLPHLTDYNLQHLRKKRIFSCHDLAIMDAESRRAVLRTLNNDEYRDVMVVLSMMPRLRIETKTVVEGEDDKHELTAGCVVTLKVTMKRSRLIDPQEAGLADQYKAYSGENEEDNGDVDQEPTENAEENTEEKKVNKKLWTKNKQNKKKKKPQGGQGQKKFQKKVAPGSPTASGATEEQPLVKAEQEDDDDEEKNSQASDNGSDDEDASGNNSDSDADAAPKSGNESDSEWEDDVASNKKSIFETKNTQTHQVHAPFYPVDKFEWWWITVAYVDKKEKTRQLLTFPQLVKTLVDEQTVDIRFAAPPHKGIYTYNLSVKSDSYMDAEYSVDFKIDVKEAKFVEIKHDDYVDDDDEEAAVSSDDSYTEDDDSD
ncbi:CBN-DNJ-29 protein [Caenorhabditis brenneri]|uniref:CBN-DNJ-29 protein n=1 Tax=Caenorhabditis brenneri TaxID=135651 RepID=G0MJD2_CAEBE|nr:CBN-DNJ-29 protein [Caenorhabditis brenneri]